MNSLMRRSETFVLFAIFLVALGGIIYSFIRPAATSKPTHLEPALPVPALDVLANRRDFLGEGTEPYTLIEFGDYECPPCRGSRPRLKELLAKYKNRLKLDFRNLPLLEIHSNAMYAAIVAEAARDQHCFWAVHSTLYESVLTDSVIDSVMKQNMKVKALSNIQIQRARNAVEADMQLATKLDLSATPSFLLACPDGKLYQLNELESISNYIK